jgi:hypothetical protein
MEVKTRTLEDRKGAAPQSSFVQTNYREYYTLRAVRSQVLDEYENRLQLLQS